MAIFYVLIIVGVLVLLSGFKRKSSKRARTKRAMFVAGGAATSFLVEQILAKHEFDQETVERLQQMDFGQLHKFVNEKGLMDEMNNFHQQMVERDLLTQTQMDQLENQMHDPYVTPGLDLVVDESYHGLDHGMGIADPFHDHHNDSFQGGGMGDF